MINLSDKTAQNIYYSLPRIAGVSLYAPINILQGIYAKHYGMALTTIAVVILLVRLFDALIDPVVGCLSDKAMSKTGTRKPYMLIGAAVIVVSGYFLYSPPSDVSVAYFAVWFMAFYIGFTLFEITHITWGGEISPHYREKTQTYNLRTAAGFTGLVLFYAIPLLPWWETSDITPETLSFSAIVSGILMLPLLYLCMKKVPNGRCDRAVKPQQQNRPKVSITLRFDYLLKNKPLIIFLCAFIFSSVGLGMWYGLVFIFIDAYLGKGDTFSEIYLIATTIGVISSFAWIHVSNWIGRKGAWIAAMCLGITSFVYTGFLTPDNASYLLLSGFLVINTLCSICMESLPHSILSDIIDYSTWKYKVYKGSTFFSIFIFSTKAAFALGAALGLATAGGYGFDPSATAHTGSSISGLMIAMVWVPIVLVSISVIFIALCSINEHRHNIIRRRLSRLASI